MLASASITAGGETEKVSRKSGQMCLSGLQGNGGGKRCEFSKRRRQEKAIMVTTSACMLLILSRVVFQTWI